MCPYRAHHLFDRRHDVWIGSAPANIAAHQLANVVDALCFAFGDQARSRANLAWRTIIALECVVVDEGLLQRVQDAFPSQSFDRGAVGPILHDSEREAGTNPPAVYQHRAGAALAMVTALFLPVRSR
jgi:hypothetical protein